MLGRQRNIDMPFSMTTYTALRPGGALPDVHLRQEDDVPRYRAERDKAYRSAVSAYGATTYLTQGAPRTFLLSVSTDL
ncbi:hypothetical protein OKW42_002481 [Paraburkholderia sp. WC7.3d]|nr:hypothetical protein [Paraburkholderia podalyriae]